MRHCERSEAIFLSSGDTMGVGVSTGEINSVESSICFSRSIGRSFAMTFFCHAHMRHCERSEAIFLGSGDTMGVGVSTLRLTLLNLRFASVAPLVAPSQ